MTKLFVYISVLILFFSPLFCVLPVNPYYPIRPNMKTTLVSDRGNSIEITSSVEITSEYDETGFFYSSWLLKVSLIEGRFMYLLNFIINKDGEMSLIEVKDLLSERMLKEPALIFPSRKNTMINSRLGDNIRIVNTSLSSNIIMQSGETNKVSSYSLIMGDIDYSIFIKSDSGILRIITQGEEFNQI
jgi:hypothetical protein